MFRTNPLGYPLISNLRLMLDGPDGDEGGGDDGEKGDEGKESKLGFPAGTPIEHMTSEQQAAYWKHQARKHEKVAKSREDYADQKAKAERLTQIEAENQTQAEKDLAAAREEARREGENIGAERYLKDAVKANFRAATGKTVDDVEAAFEHIDAKSFIDAEGNIDNTKLDAFAKSFGGGDEHKQDSQIDPVKAALERQRQGGSGSGSGSVEEIRKARLEKLTASKK